MIKVRVMKAFFDKEKKILRKVGEVYMCSVNRCEELKNGGFVDVWYKNKECRSEAEKIKNKKPEKRQHRFRRKYPEQRSSRMYVTENNIGKYNDDVLKSLLETLYIKKIPQKKLAYQVCGRQHQKFSDIDSMDKKRRTITYIRHNLSNYDSLLSLIGGKYKDCRYGYHHALKIEVYELIRRAYDNLSSMCDTLEREDVKEFSKQDNWNRLLAEEGN